MRTTPRRVGALGMTLQAWEQWETAHAAYERAQSLSAQTADWLYLDGVVLQRLGRPAEAASGSACPDARAGVRAGQGAAGRGAVRRRRSRGQPRAPTRRLPAEPSAAPVAALGLGRIAARDGRHDEAVAHFDSAPSRCFPEFGAAYYGLAQSLRALAGPEEARDALKQQRTYGARWPAIDDPLAASGGDARRPARAPLARTAPGRTWRSGRRHRVARSGARRGNPSLAQARANLISLYGRTGQWEKAEAQYRALLAMGFNEDEAHYNYGVLLGLQRAMERGGGRLSAWRSRPTRCTRRRTTTSGSCSKASASWPRRRSNTGRPWRPTRSCVWHATIFGRMLLAVQRQSTRPPPSSSKLREPQDAESPRYLYALAVANVQAGRREAGRGAGAAGAAAGRALRPARAGGRHRPRPGRAQMRAARAGRSARRAAARRCQPASECALRGGRRGRGR